jgi:hypothetical protein
MQTDFNPFNDNSPSSLDSRLSALLAAHPAAGRLFKNRQSTLIDKIIFILQEKFKSTIVVCMHVKIKYEL